MAETRPGEVCCSCSSACSEGLEKKKMAAQHVVSLKPAEDSGCPTCGTRLALKELKIQDNKEMVVVGSMKTTTTKKKHPRPDESPEPAAANKRRKKVMVGLGKEYVEYMKKHPPPPPSQPVKLYHWRLRDLQDEYVARQRAQREERDRIIKQYEDHGYAYKEVEVTDDEAED